MVRRGRGDSACRLPIAGRGKTTVSLRWDEEEKERAAWERERGAEWAGGATWCPMNRNFLKRKEKRKKKRNKEKIRGHEALSDLPISNRESLIAKRLLKYYKFFRNYILSPNFKILLHFSTSNFIFYLQILKNFQFNPKQNYHFNSRFLGF